MDLFGHFDLSMSPTSEPVVLPLPLLLLVHLYILQYPRANDVEYDHNIFNPRVRGLRDRTRTMEDIAFFLVGRIEGKGIKTVCYACFLSCFWADRSKDFVDLSMSSTV